MASQISLLAATLGESANFELTARNEEQKINLKMKFESIIAPLDNKEFAKKYFRKTIFHLKGTGNKYNSLFTWDMLNEILEFQQFGVARLNLVKKGERFTDIYDYETPKFPNLPFKPILKYETIREELKTGSVIVVNAINQMLPSVRELTESFQ